MANNVFHSDPDLANVKITAHSPTSKTDAGRIATIKINDVELPFHFSGDTVDEAKTNAANFYKANVLNKLFDFSAFADVDGIQKVILALFSKKKPKKEKVVKEKHDLKDLLWYVSETKTVRIPADQVEQHEKDGFLPGKKWEVALARHENGGSRVIHKKTAEGYVNPIKGKILIHKGTDTLRIFDAELADYTKEGWAKGRVPKAGEVPVEAPEKAADKVSEEKGADVPAETETAVAA